MAKPNQTKPAQTDGIRNDTAGADLGDFTEKEALGFPAYWKTEVGAQFAARVIQLDDSDPDFQRWIFQATRHDVTCGRGPAKDAKEEIVRVGDFFSTSAYAQFGNNESGRGLHQYIGEEVLIKCTGTVDTGQPTPMFVHEVHVTKETRTRLLARRQEMVNGQFAGKVPVASIAKPAATA